MSDTGPLSGLRRYGSLESFYSEDLQRERSRERDFGCDWRFDVHQHWPRFRVSFIETTGELYARELLGKGGRVILLTTFSDADAAEVALQGWAELPEDRSTVVDLATRLRR